MKVTILSNGVDLDVKKIRFRLKEWCEETGLSQRAVSRITKIRFPTISAIANNNTEIISLENLAKLCEVFNKPVSEFFEEYEVEGDRKYDWEAGATPQRRRGIFKEIDDPEAIQEILKTSEE